MPILTSILTGVKMVRTRNWISKSLRRETNGFSCFSSFSKPSDDLAETNGLYPLSMSR